MTPSRAWNEVREIAQIDRNGDGKIDRNDLAALREMNVRIGAGATTLEIFTTHPNMVKRIKQLAL